MPNFVVKEKKLLQCEAICENIGATWKDLKYERGKITIMPTMFLQQQLFLHKAIPTFLQPKIV
jgi:hypothetical protein